MMSHFNKNRCKDIAQNYLYAIDIDYVTTETKTDISLLGLSFALFSEGTTYAVLFMDMVSIHY
jgi:hypothetical protein